jgi:hypothetical protein
MSSKRRARQQAKRRALAGGVVTGVSVAAAGASGFSQMPNVWQLLFLLIAVGMTVWTSWRDSKPLGVKWMDVKKKVFSF